MRKTYKINVKDRAMEFPSLFLFQRCRKKRDQLVGSYVVADIDGEILEAASQVYESEQEAFDNAVYHITKYNTDLIEVDTNAPVELPTSIQQRDDHFRGGEYAWHAMDESM